MFGKNKTEEVVVEKAEKKPDEDWMTKKWRPMMAMMYMTCCLFDFALFPIMFTVVQFWEVQAANDAFRQWVPITLQGGGLFHVAMGAVLGVSAYGRTQEKVAGAANISTSVPTPELSSAPPAPSSFGGGFNSAPVTTAAAPSNSFGGSFDSAPADIGFGAPTSAPKPIVRRPV
jgi:hypothetical protein